MVRALKILEDAQVFDLRSGEDITGIETPENRLGRIYKEFESFTGQSIGQIPPNNAKAFDGYLLRMWDDPEVKSALKWLIDEEEPYAFTRTFPIVNPYYYVQNAVIGSRGELEPLPAMDNKYRFTYNAILETGYNELVIYTGYDLVAHEDYMEIIPEGSTVYFEDLGQCSFLRLQRAAAKLEQNSIQAKIIK